MCKSKFNCDCELLVSNGWLRVKIGIWFDTECDIDVLGLMESTVDEDVNVDDDVDVVEDSDVEDEIGEMGNSGLTKEVPGWDRCWATLFCCISLCSHKAFAVSFERIADAIETVGLSTVEWEENPVAAKALASAS